MSWRCWVCVRVEMVGNACTALVVWREQSIVILGLMWISGLMKIRERKSRKGITDS